MLSIKQLYSNITKYFTKTRNIDDIETKPENVCTIELSLNKNFEVDISIEFSEINIKSETEYKKYVQKIAEFLNIINTSYVTYTLANLIIKDIGNDPSYKDFTNSIISKWTILEKEKEDYKNIHSSNIIPIIKPTEVFSKYFHQQK